MIEIKFCNRYIYSCMQMTNFLIECGKLNNHIRNWSMVVCVYNQFFLGNNFSWKLNSHWNDKIHPIWLNFDLKFNTQYFRERERDEIDGERWI